MTLRVLQIALICVIGVCGFWLGVLLAYQADVAQEKLPDVWSGERAELEAKPSYGYQTPHEYIEQPAYNIVELEPLQEL